MLCVRGRTPSGIQIPLGVHGRTPSGIQIPLGVRGRVPVNGCLITDPWLVKISQSMKPYKLRGSGHYKILN